ncbi:MAG: TonB-dependent receptor [Bacteroidaceae bacterium]|nr:TonB-dependent receptor [Bacteroidaceae bacterium]
MKKQFVILSVLLSVPALAQNVDELSKQLDEVVVTATGTPHTLKNVPVQTEIISHKQIEQLGAASFEDILSQLSSGFDFNAGDMGSQMTLNGLGNNYILIMIDGKRLNGDNGGENDLGRIDPHNIDHIEIVKGAGSALYGSDAIAGVINIITRRHDDQALYLENTTRGGSYLDLRQHNSIGFSIGKFTSLTTFQLQHSDGWQNTSEEDPAQTEYHIYDSRNKTVNMYTNGQLSERISYTPSDRLSFQADGYLYRKRIYRPTNGRHPSCDVNTFDMKYRDAGASFGSDYKLNGTDRITLDVSWDRHAYYYHYTDTTLEEGYDPNGNYTPYYPYFPDQEHLQSDQQRTMAELKGIFSLPLSNLLSAGAEYRYDYLNAPMRVKGGKADDWTAALYLQDEFTGLDWLNVTAGIRLIENKAFGFHATPKISAMFKAGDFRLRTGWSKGFKSPTPKEQGYHYLRTMGATTFFYMGNPDLKPQTSDYISAGIEYSRGGFSASVTGYRNELFNMITLVNVPLSQIPAGSAPEYMGDGSGSITPRMYMNMEDARTMGIDASFTWRITSDITLGGSYSWLDTKAHVYDTKHDRLDEVTIEGMAHHKGNVYSTWQHRFNDAYRLGLGLYGRASSTRYYQNNGNGKPYQIWKLTTTHDLGRSRNGLIWRIEAGIDNILDYKETTPHGLHYGTTTPGRTFYCTLSIKFSKGKKMNTKDVERGSMDDDD